MPNPSKSKTDYLANFVPEAHYHVYNRTNNREALFHDDTDRRFFMEQYKRFVADYVDTYAYCLLPNHFHWAVRIKSAVALAALSEQIPAPQRTAAQHFLLAQQEEERDFHRLLERQFTRMFTAYAMFFNGRYTRSGNLFHRPFKRIAVDDDNHLNWLVYYVHHNPKKHGITHDFLQYPWSSYAALISQKSTALSREAVWALFGSKAHFIAFHEGQEPPKPEGWDLEIEY